MLLFSVPNSKNDLSEQKLKNEYEAKIEELVRQSRAMKGLIHFL